MFSSKQTIQNIDPDVWQAIKSEIERQEDHIELIASENYASPAVMQAQGSVLTNKYAEGYPGKRYYGGCEYVDLVEQYAIDRAKSLFAAEYVNVQPHSGSQANAAVYLSVLRPGDTLLGMSLAHGGHLTHGASVNLSGKIFNSVAYGLNPDTEELDYCELERLAFVKLQMMWELIYLWIWLITPDWWRQGFILIRLELLILLPALHTKHYVGHGAVLLWQSPSMKRRSIQRFFHRPRVGQ
jgi:hypothetical protein